MNIIERELVHKRASLNKLYFADIKQRVTREKSDTLKIPTNLYVEKLENSILCLVGFCYADEGAHKCAPSNSFIFGIFQEDS